MSASARVDLAVTSFTLGTITGAVIIATTAALFATSERIEKTLPRLDPIAVEVGGCCCEVAR